MSNASNAPSSQPVLRAYTILVADALDSVSELALLQGVSLATRTPGAELHLVHVPRQEPVDEGAAFAVVKREQTYQAAAEELRRRVQRAWHQEGELQVIAHFRDGDAASAILQAAIDIDADVIVVGSHHRRGVAKVVLGSVAERVLHAARCPVYIALPKNHGDASASEHLDPACPDCLATRRASANATFWCERHSRPHLQPHIYVPRDESRNSAFPTY